MRVAFITTSFPRFEGDYAGIFVYDLARTLVEHGHSIHVVAPHHGNTCRHTIMDGIRVTRFPYFFPTRWQNVAYGAGIPTNLRKSWIAKIQLMPFVASLFSALPRAIASSDLIHAHWIEPAFISLPWNWLYKRPLVVNVHQFNPSGFRMPLYKTILSRADHVVFNSTFTQARCEELTKSKGGSVIPPGIDTTRFGASANGHKSKLAIIGEGNLVVGLGRLIPFKGFIHLIEAMPLVLEKVSCHFAIGGQGPERDKLLQRARELGVDGHLTLLGIVPTDEVPDLMRAASVFALPSISSPSSENETLGMVLVEALASGTPCVASRTGGTVDVVDDGLNGYLVTPGDPTEIASRIITLLQDEELRKKMGCAGRCKVEREFALDVVARRTIAVYDKVIARDKSS